MSTTEKMPQTTAQLPPDQQWWVDDPRMAEIVAEQSQDLAPIPRLDREQSIELQQEVRKAVAESISAGERLDPKYHQALEALGRGWKIHLNVDADNLDHAEKVRATLIDMQEQGMFAMSKVGDGGGKDHDQVGKEATVYVGSRQRMIAVAQELESSLGNVLIAPEGETLKDDEIVSPYIAARFDIGSIDDRFNQYGEAGLPYMKDDVSNALYGDIDSAFLHMNARNQLSRTYGEYFTS